MTTNPSHAAPWTFRRALAMLVPAPTQRRIERESRQQLYMSGREAVARALYGEREGWDAKQMADYDASPYLSRAWLAEADRRIAHAKSQDRHVAAFHGIKDADWIHLSSLAKVDHREAFWKAKGL